MRSRKYFYYFDGNFPQDVANMGYNVWNWDAQESVMWQEVGKSNRVTNNGDPVAVWTDTVSGVDAIQATTANKPTYTTNSLNGLPTLGYDGGDFLATANISISTFAVWAVFKTASNGWIYNHYSTSNTIGTGIGAGGQPAAISCIVTRAFTESRKQATTGWANDNIWALARHEYQGTNATNLLYKNNAPVTLTTLTAGNPGTGLQSAPLYFGVLGRPTPGGYFTGNIAHMCIVSPYPTPAIIANMESYINTKWGVY